MVKVLELKLPKILLFYLNLLWIVSKNDQKKLRNFKCLFQICSRILDFFNFKGNWWSDWILCPQDTFIIGVQTQVEESLGKGDDTALNNIRFACSARDEWFMMEWSN